MQSPLKRFKVEHYHQGLPIQQNERQYKLGCTNKN